MFDLRTFRHRIAPLTVVVASLLVAAFVKWGMTRLEYRGTYERADHRYAVTVYRKRSAWPTVQPLDFTDFPAEVRLEDASGHVLESTSVGSMKKFGEVTWRERRVTIQGVADWSLPD